MLLASVEVNIRYLKILLGDKYNSHNDYTLMVFIWVRFLSKITFGNWVSALLLDNVIFNFYWVLFIQIYNLSKLRVKLNLYKQIAMNKVNKF